MRYITDSYSSLLPNIMTEFYNTLVPRLPELRSYLINKDQLVESDIELPDGHRLVVLQNGFSFYLSGSNTYCSFDQLHDWVKTLFIKEDFIRDVNEKLDGSEYKLYDIRLEHKDSIGVPRCITLQITIDGDEPDEWMDEDHETAILNLILPVVSKYSVSVSFPSYYYGQ